MHAGPDRLLADAAGIAHAADARLSAALDDLFVADQVRSTDRQRASMRLMLDGLVQEVEADLRAALVGRLGPAAPEVLGVGRVSIIRPVFDRAGVLRDRELVALLLARAEEHRICTALRHAADGTSDTSVSAEGFECGDPALDLALKRAESRRFDQSAAPRLAACDLPAELLHRLLWWSAAALRDHLNRTTGLSPDLRDDALAGAVLTRLAGHDEGLTLDAAAMRVALAMEPDRPELLDVLRSGRISLFAALLARQAGIDQPAAFLLLSQTRAGARSPFCCARSTCRSRPPRPCCCRWPRPMACRTRPSRR